MTFLDRDSSSIHGAFTESFFNYKVTVILLCNGPIGHTHLYWRGGSCPDPGPYRTGLRRMALAPARRGPSGAPRHNGRRAFSSPRRSWWRPPHAPVKKGREPPFGGKSLFILWITVPRSSVRPSLTRAWWLSATGYVAALEPPPGRGGRQWLGSPPGIAPGLVSQKATARSPGRQPFWPTQSHLLHPMALQWPERAERALSHVKP